MASTKPNHRMVPHGEVTVTCHAVRRWAQRIGPGGTDCVRRHYAESRPANKRELARWRRRAKHGRLYAVHKERGAVFVVQEEPTGWMLKTVLRESSLAAAGEARRE